MAGGKAAEVDEMDEVGFGDEQEVTEPAVEGAVIVFGLEDVLLALDGFVGVPEAMDGEVVEFVLVGAFGDRDGGIGGFGGDDGDVVAAALEFLRGVVDDQFGAGGIFRQKLVSGEEDLHRYTPSCRTPRCSRSSRAPVVLPLHARVHQERHFQHEAELSQ